MKELRVLLIDDEKPARERLRRLLAAFPGVLVVGEAADGISALEACYTQSPDAIFLDIDMPELTGIEVAATLNGQGPSVVFCTAYDEFAIKAFALNACDYLLKPVEAPRLANAVAKLRALHEKKSLAAAEPLAGAGDLKRLLTQLSGAKCWAQLAVRTGARFIVCETREVAAIVANDHYSEIICGEKKLLADDSLDQLEARLDANEFLRVHRGGIINLKYLRELRRVGDRKYVCVLGDFFATEVAVSREKLARLKQVLGLAEA